MEHLKSLIGKVCGGDNLTRAEMADAVAVMMAGQFDEGQLGVFLTALREKGETVDEVVGAAEAMRACMLRPPVTRKPLVDTCGTGGDGSCSFNISTAAALVAAASGAAVAKHGNRSITSKTGSADVLTELGVNIEAPLERVGKNIDELGFGFCFAPLCHPSMKHVSQVRKKLGKPTIFNLLGPLANPAAAEYQVLGVGKPHLHRLLAEALAKLGTKRAFVVCGGDGLDEITLNGPTRVLEAVEGGLHEHSWNPSDFGLPSSTLGGMQVDNPQESAEVIRALFRGVKGPARDIVLANAAAALFVSGAAKSLKEGVSVCAKAIDAGKATELLNKLAER